MTWQGDDVQVKSCLLLRCLVVGEKLLLSAVLEAMSGCSFQLWAPQHSTLSVLEPHPGEGWKLEPRMCWENEVLSSPSRDGLAEGKGRCFTLYKCLVWSGKGDGAKLALKVHRGRTRGNRDKLEDRSFRTDRKPWFLPQGWSHTWYPGVGNYRIYIAGGTWSANQTRLWGSCFNEPCS